MSLFRRSELSRRERRHPPSGRLKRSKALRRKGEEPAKDKTPKRKAKKRKLTGSVPDCEDEVAVDSGSEDEEDGLVGALNLN
jgi:hypothetical protein